MSIFKRAFLYLWRKKIRTLFILLIVTFIFTFILIGEGLQRAIASASQNVEKGSSSYFLIDYTPSSYASGSDFVDPLTLKVSDDLKDVKGISEMVASAQIPGPINNVSPVAGIDSSAFFNFIMTNNSTKNLSFRSNSVELSSGRHIEPEDKNVGMISEEVATKNNLKLGDTLDASVDPATAGYLNIDSSKTNKIKIVGIYKVLYRSSSDKMITENLADNQVYIDYQSMKELFQTKNVNNISLDSLYCYVDDPSKMNEIMSEVKSKIDTSRFQVTSNDKTYQKVQQPMDNLKKLSKSMIRNITIISLVILMLLWFLWSKSRIREMGILLAAGKSKINIMLQLMTEFLIIVVLATCAAFFISNYFGSTVSNYFVKEVNQASSEKSNDFVNDGTVGQQLAAANISNNISTEDIQIKIKKIDFLKIIPLGLLLVIVIVPLGSITILKLKPRQILSTME